MKYIVEFWNPWAGEWQRWNMEPVGIVDIFHMLADRMRCDRSFERRVVDTTN